MPSDTNLRHKPSIFSEDIIDEVVEIKDYDKNEYCLTNHLTYFMPWLEEKLEDGMLIDLRAELSDNDLR